MECNYIHIKLKDKDNIHLNKNKILGLFKLSIGNNVINLNYNKNKKESLNQNMQIIYYQKYFKKNVGKMRYIYLDNSNSIKILDKRFILNNIKRANIIINNKEYKLKENIGYSELKILFLVKIKFLDKIINLNSMFEGCKSLSHIYNFQNLNIKYLKAIYNLFYGCNSLININDISDWNLINANDISGIFCGCSSLKELPDISKWNISNANNITDLFYKCSSLKYLPDISK